MPFCPGFSELLIAGTYSSGEQQVVTVIISTTNRPQMLRTALRSVDQQTAKDKIGAVIVSENALNKASADVCAEFPDLPIIYVYRDPTLKSLDHGLALFSEAADQSSEHVAILHDDDWWGVHHLATGLAELERDEAAVAYWSASFLVQGESSWYLQCWNESVWIATGFQSVNQIARLNRKQAALACVGGGPAHYSTLITRKESLRDCFSEVAKTGNLFDNDRLLFLELAKRGPLLVNLVPEVFVRLHQGQDQSAFSFAESSDHIAAATRSVLAFCKDEGIDVLREFERLSEECPVENYRYSLTGTFDTRVALELQRQNAMPRLSLPRPRRTAKWFIHQVCPPVGWRAARQLYRFARAEPPKLNRPI